ncbi:MAG: dhaL [Clostridia bacterium]|jgi:dihydroxyacetone kinase-like protein|nr:dhaL [Clostridia bacterium]
MMENLFLGAIIAIKESIDCNKEFLTELDREIGDADHGINMARGFEAVVNKLLADPQTDLAAGLKKIGMTLLSTVGGASGPLYGTAFMRAAIPAQGKTEASKELGAEMLQAAIQGIKDRGKAVCGEKTMLDSMEPAYYAFAEGIAKDKGFLECLELACCAAEEGVEYTKTIIAKKGRASYLGERSLGHQDPGATSVLIILRALTDFYRKNS